MQKEKKIAKSRRDKERNYTPATGPHALLLAETEREATPLDRYQCEKVASSLLNSRPKKPSLFSSKNKTSKTSKVREKTGKKEIGHEQKDCNQTKQIFSSRYDRTIIFHPGTHLDTSSVKMHSCTKSFFHPRTHLDSSFMKMHSPAKSFFHPGTFLDSSFVKMYSRAKSFCFLKTHARFKLGLS